MLIHKRATGSAVPGHMGGHCRPLITGADRDWVLAEVERNPCDDRHAEPGFGARVEAASRQRRALRCDRIEAPWVLNGPINGAAFRTYVAAELIKTLKPGDIVVLDNLGSHQGTEVRATVRRTGAKLVFLPSYSPHLNPIEQLFSKLKCAMRKGTGRTVEAVHDALAAILETIPPTECENHLANAGYKSI